MRLALIPLTGAALIALAGCVPQSQYDDLMNAYRSKEQQLLQLQNEFDTSRANEDMLRKQLGEAMARLTSIQNGGNQAEIDALKKQIDDLIAQIGQKALPDDVSNMIVQLVEMYPDVLEFDDHCVKRAGTVTVGRVLIDGGVVGPCRRSYRCRWTKETSLMI